MYFLKFKKLKLGNLLLYLFFSTPLLLNFISNVINNELENLTFNIFDITSSLLIFYFLYQIGKQIKLLTKNITISTGIIVYLFSFYLCNLLVLFFVGDFTFNVNFLITNIFWIVIFLLKYKNAKPLKQVTLSYLSMIIFNRYLYFLQSKNVNIFGDVESVFFPISKSIYENGLKYSLLYPKMGGYPHFMSYLDSLIYKISFNANDFDFYISNSILYFWLYFLLVTEIFSSKRLKMFTVSIYFLFLINSSWIQFLFLTSLMSERVAGYLFLALTHVIYKNLDNRNINFIAYFAFGFIYFTKQFFILIFLILTFYFIVKAKNKINLIFLFSPLIIDLIAKNSYLSKAPVDSRVSEIDLQDTILDLLLGRNLDLKNVNLIFKNLFIDKPFTYIFFLTIIFIIISLLIKNRDTFVLLLSSVIFMNIIFTFLLYISVWRNMELESPIRYLLSTLPINLILLTYGIESINERLSKIIS